MDGGASVVMMSEVGAKRTVMAITNYQPSTPSTSLTNASKGEVCEETYVIDHTHLSSIQ
jgi:hypothetical protein